MSRLRPGTRTAKAIRLGAVAVLLAALGASAAPAAGAADTGPYPGSLPDTPSATNVSGRGAFSDLAVHVNQTADLTTQAVSLTWNWPDRGTQSGYDDLGNQAYATNVLRIMQCWGDAVTSPGTDAVTAANYVADNPGPAREHCVYGGSLTPSPTITADNQANRTASSYVTGTPTSFGQETAYQPVRPGGAPDIPFVAANGTVVPHQTAPNDRGIQVYANEFYDRYSTNESPANYTFGPEGRGGLQYQVQNADDSRGLGCGAKAAGGSSLNKCWLVIVPQGTTDYDGKPLQIRKSSSYRSAAFTSPLASTNWSNRLAIPLNFLPVQSACSSTAATYETLGSPLVKNAMLSWQSRLCATSGTVFNYSLGTDQRSRDALGSGGGTMQFVSDPTPAESVTTPITYAPVTLSGIGIAFVWDAATRNTKTSVVTPGQPLSGIRLNQRLVAKLLTYSYVDGNSTRIGDNGAERVPGPEAYTWLDKNPAWIGEDPEFLALNPELTQDLPKATVLLRTTPSIATIQGPSDPSDAVARLWQWITADKDARAFLAGAPDPYGMQVDPYYSTNADLSPNGYAFDTKIDDLPYSDPWAGIPGNSERSCADQPKLSMSDIWPAARDLSTVAQDVLTVNPLEKYTGGYTCVKDSSDINPPGWKTSRSGIVTAGTRQLMGLTDTASGAQYGVTFASLRNGADPAQYVAPTAANVAAAATHLTDTGVKGVVQPDLASTDTSAYPLSLITYAGVTTNGMSRDTCAAYAELLDYAASTGQEQGTAIGQLPPGYVPLPATLRAQTTAAARTVAQCAQAPKEPTTADPTPVADEPVPADAAPAGDSPVEAAADADTPAVEGPTSAPASAAPPATLAASSTTKPDPSVFAYVVPIALGVGLLSLLAAPLSGVRRRHTAPPGTG